MTRESSVYGASDSDKRVKLINSDGAFVGTDTNRLKTEAQVPDLYVVFGDILKELKKTNMHLAMITDVHLRDSDI